MAITQAEAVAAVNMPYTGAGGSVPMTTPCAVNDLIVVFMRMLNASNNVIPTISDNVNTGPYLSAPGNFFDAVHGVYINMYYKACNAAGIPTIATGSLLALGGGGVGGPVSAVRFTGFTGVPTIDALGGLTTGTTFSVVGPGGVTGYNPELLVNVLGGDGSVHLPVNTSGWTYVVQAAAMYPGYKVSTAAPGASAAFTETLDAGVKWGCQTAGFYSAVVVVATPTEQVLLDDPLRVGGSSQLFLGTVLDDTTGDTIHAGGADLKLWAADLNAMLAALFPATQILGDANLTPLVTDAKFILQNVTLTANRTIALPMSGLKDGMKFKVVRRAATPGAFTLTITGGPASVVIAANTNGFAHFRAVSATAWTCEAQGTLP